MKSALPGMRTLFAICDDVRFMFIDHEKLKLTEALTALARYARAIDTIRLSETQFDVISGHAELVMEHIRIGGHLRYRLEERHEQT